MKDFGAWFSDQGKGETEEADDTILLRCVSCGKEEYVSRAAYESGWTAWYSDNESTGDGLCGSGPHCMP